MTAASTRSEARDGDRDAARVAADRFATSLTAVISSVAGVDALGVDGIVSREEFEAFAVDVAAAGAFPALAYVELVDDADRAAWEAATGAAMQDTDGAGELVVAARRPVHAVVRFAAPVTDTTRRVIGFDLMSDPVRARGIAAAGADDGGQLVGPISTVTDARRGLFLTAAIRDPANRVLGFVAAGISLDEAADRLAALSEITDVVVTMDGGPLLEGSPGKATAMFELAGRTFTVHASDGRPSNWVSTYLLALATVVLGVGAVRAVRRDRRTRARERRASERAARLAAFAEALGNASTTGQTAQLAADQAGPTLGARYTNVGIPLVTDPAKLQVVHDTRMLPSLADRFEFQSMADDFPLTEAARTGATVWIANRDEYAARYPHVIDDVVAAGIHAVCCTPLSLGSASSTGVIGFAFDQPLSGRERAEIESAASVISQMTGRALDRARLRELVQERVDLLAELARELTTVRSSADVAAAVAGMVPPLLDLDAAELVEGAPSDARSSTRIYRPGGADGVQLVLHLGPARVWAAIDETLATTVTDLVGGALSRTRLHDQERAVLHRFQASLLMEPPRIDGFDVAVGYRSALAAVGMGGDWYSIIDTPGAVYAVIGDVAGHGPGAVALMAEVKTVMRHLLTTGTSLEEAARHADHTLQRRHAFASMFAVRIDKHRPRLEYLNAGHLPAVRYRDGGVEHIGEIHRPWLGVEPSDAKRATSIDHRPGDLLLLYTDGLVEQRDEPLDDSIRTRLHGIDPRRPVDELVEGLLAARLDERTAATVDDDVAAVAIRRA